MYYTNISNSVRTFYGVKFGAHETKEVPGYINAPKMIVAKELPKAPKQPKKDDKKPATAPKNTESTEKKPEPQVKEADKVSDSEDIVKDVKPDDN